MSRFLVASLAILAFAAPATAQCGNMLGMTFSEYGDGCSAFFQDPPYLTGSYSPTACTVTLNLAGWGGNCGGICMAQRVLAFGLAPAMVPLPFVPCDLLIVPDLILGFPPAAGDTFVFNVSVAQLAGYTLYAQGAHDFLVNGTTHMYEVSNGLAITIF